MDDGSDNRGQWQAQGNDISADGHAIPWNHSSWVTKSEGLAMLGTLSAICTASQRELREEVCKQARRYIKRAPIHGIEGFHMKSFPVKSPPHRARNARIDLEITTGRAFCDDPMSKASM